MKVHITGGKGFLGRYIADALASSYDLDISDVDTLDVTDLDATVARLVEDKPEVVCHLAGLTGAQASIEQPHRFFEANCGGTLNVLEACRAADVRRFVFMSSLSVHGASNGRVVDEASPYQPQHPYAASKAAAEILVRNYAKCYGISSVILRPTLISGEGQNEPSAVTEFINVALEGGTVEIYGEGKHRREWLHPEDLARAVGAAVDFLAQNRSVETETFILSSGAPVSMRDLAEKVISALGKGRLEFRPATRQAFDLYTGSTRARDKLNWASKIGIEEIISRIARQQLSDNCKKEM